MPLTDPPDFDEPESWRVFALSVSARPHADARPETAVFVRRDGTEKALAKLLCAMANWIRDRRPLDAVLSFNGESFDFPILDSHITTVEARDPEFAAYVRESLDIPHRDLFKEIIENQPEHVKYPSLTESLESRGIDAGTKTYNGEIVDGALVPAFGERILDPEKSLTDYQRAVLQRYSRSDVVPLHQLCDAMDHERAGDVEASVGGRR